MKIQHLLFASLLTLSPVLNIWGDDAPPRFEITPFGGYRMSGSLALNESSYSRLDFADGGIYGVSAGMRVVTGEELGEGLIEVMWTHQGSEISAIPNSGTTGTPIQSLTLNVDQFHFNGIYYLPDFEKTFPYVLAGVGATRFAPTGDIQSLTRLSWALGGGVKIPLRRRFALRLEAKWDPAMAQTSGGVFCNTATGQCYTAASGTLMQQIDFTAGLTIGF
jgi:opacity protein-like surface antigen